MLPIYSNISYPEHWQIYNQDDLYQLILLYFDIDLILLVTLVEHSFIS